MRALVNSVTYWDVVCQNKIFGLDGKKLQYLKTAFTLNLPRFYRDIYDYDAAGVDLVITDYEPLSARIARRFRIPSIGIGHQYAFYFDIPIAGANLFTRRLLQAFAPADHPIGLHWHHFGQPILPPIIPGHLDDTRPVEADKVLVYLPFDHPDEVQTLLAPFYYPSLFHLRHRRTQFPGRQGTSAPASLFA
jgi:uncharacterized protein (TIGR00661 family)